MKTLDACPRCQQPMTGLAYGQPRCIPCSGITPSGDPFRLHRAAAVIAANRKATLHRIATDAPIIPDVAPQRKHPPKRAVVIVVARNDDKRRRGPSDPVPTLRERLRARHLQSWKDAGLR